jgi:hypothetical protein
VSIATYNLAVDFDDNGLYTGTGEDVTARVLPDRGLTCERGKDQIRSLSPPMAGRLDASLDNRSRDYSPENGASPLVGKLVPGHRVRLRATFSAVTYDLFTGTLDDLPQHPGLGARAVDMPCLGSLSRLKGVKVSTALYQYVRTDQALGYLLDAAGWPAGDRVLSAGKTTLLWWWCDDADAFEMAVTLLNTEGPGASLYEDGQGRIVFEDRHYRLLTARCTTSQATIRDSGAEPLHTEPFAYNPGLKDTITRATARVNVRTVQALDVAWQLGQDISLGASQVLTFRATTGDPVTGAVAPVAGTDYTVLAGAVTSVTLDRTSGSRIGVTVTAGTGGATVRGLQVRAQKLTAQATDIVSAPVTPAPRVERGYSLALWPEVQPNVAQDLCDAIVRAYKDARPTVSLTLEGASATMLTHLLSREISDRVTAVEAQTGLNAPMFVERIAHAVDMAGSRHRATLGLEKITDTMYPPAVVTIDGDAAHGIGSAAIIWY